MAWSIFFLFSKTTRTSLSCCPSNPKGWYVQPPEKHTLLRVITTVTLFCHSFWHLMWKYIWHVFSDILFWLSIRILFWHSFWHLFWHFIWHSIWHSIMAFYLKSKIYNILWHSAFSLAISLACVRIQGHSTASWARDVAPGPGHSTTPRARDAASRPRSWDPAVPTVIWSWQLRSGRRKEKEKGQVNLIKSRDPHLAGGETNLNLNFDHHPSSVGQHVFEASYIG